MAKRDLGFHGIRGEFLVAFSQAEQGTFYRLLGQMVNSDQPEEVYRWLRNAPAMREWIGGRLEVEMGDDVYRIPNLKFEATVPVLYDELQDDKTGSLLMRIRDVAAKAANLWDALLSTLINNGDTSAGICYDGQQFFDTDHVTGASGTQNNNLAAAQVASLNVGTPTAPTALEMANIIMDLATYFLGYKDDRGEPINQNARRFAVMVPAAGTFPASLMKALGNEYLAAGTSNPLKGTGFEFVPIINPRSDWTTEMALFRLDGPKPLFVLQEREPVTAGWLAEGSDTAFREDRYLFGVKARRNVGYGFWDQAIKATLS